MTIRSMLCNVLATLLSVLIMALATVPAQAQPAPSPAPTVTWTVQPTLPPGITLSPQGLLSGTPCRAGIYNFTVRATDTTSGTYAEKALSLVIQPKITIADVWIDPKPIGTSFQINLTATIVMDTCSTTPSP